LRGAPRFAYPGVRARAARDAGVGPDSRVPVAETRTRTMPKPLVQRMYLRPGYRALILHAPEGFGLADVPADVALTSLAAGHADVDALGTDADRAALRALEPGSVDWILFFATSAQVLRRRLGAVQGLLHDGGLLWVAYPKGVERAAVATDLKREVVWRAGADFGFQSVAQVAVDDVWSAMRMKVSADAHYPRSSARS